MMALINAISINSRPNSVWEHHIHSLLKFVQGHRHLILRDTQRREQADSLLDAGRDQQQSLVKPGLDNGGRRIRHRVTPETTRLEFQGHHEPPTSDLRDGILPREFHKSPHELLAPDTGVGDHFILADGLQGATGSRARERAATVRSSHHAGRHLVKRVVPRGETRDGKPGRDALGKHKDIGLHGGEALVGPPRSGPPDARLDLIEDQQHIVVRANLAELLQIPRRWHQESSLPKDWLDNDCRRL
mmetsp:Transcript_12794/g.36613  ORF Transcript_12794/g.36613 Transcript_12794/m.36613 type:complete len:245 (+) Transcript_12794:7606-8340(+)